MAFAEKPPQPPPPESLGDPDTLFRYLVQLLAYLERMRASIP